MNFTYALPEFSQSAGLHSRVHLERVRSRDASRAQGPEALKVSARVQQIQGDTYLGEDEENAETLFYNHIAPKILFSVTCQYRYVGALKPRRFPLHDE